MSQGVAFCCMGFGWAASVSVFGDEVCGEWLDELSRNGLATKSDTFATECDRNSPDCDMGAKPWMNTDAHGWGGRMVDGVGMGGSCWCVYTRGCGMLGGFLFFGGFFEPRRLEDPEVGGRGEGGVNAKCEVRNAKLGGGERGWVGLGCPVFAGTRYCGRRVFVGRLFLGIKTDE
jgi:hypothetical protein